MATLPDKSAEDGFLKLVLDRECAFFVTEVLAAREATIGSEALIASAKGRAGQLTMENAIYKVISPGHPMFHAGFRNLCYWTNSLAWGDAILRWAGRLPAVASFAPQPTLGLCKIKQCACKGKLPHRDMLAVLKAAPQPDWKPFFDWAEAERKAGRLLAPSAAALRAKLAYVMDRTDNAFCSELEFRDSFSNVMPLPAEVAQGLDAADTSSYGALQCSHLASRGMTFRDIEIRTIRAVGNAYHAQAKLQSGAEAAASLELARKSYRSIMNKGGVEAFTAMSNLAVIALEDKDYPEAISRAGVAMTGCHQLMHQPNSFDSQRRAFMTLFRFGMLHDMPEDRSRKLDADEAATVDRIYFKAQCRTLQGHIGECNADMQLAEETHRPVDERTLPNIQAAEHLFKGIELSKFSVPPTYKHEVDALMSRFRDLAPAPPRVSRRGDEYTISFR